MIGRKFEQERLLEKDYGTYFSILSLIAAGNNTRSEIENVIGADVAAI